MNIAFYTMTLMFSVLTLLLSGFLVLSASYARSIRGVWSWAAASFCYSLASFIISISVTATENRWLVGLLAVLVMTAVSMQFSGIQAFQKRRISWSVPLLLVGAAFGQCVFFSLAYPNSASWARAIANSIIFALANAVCARALLIRIAKPLRTAYWVTGTAFALIAVASVNRAIMIFVSRPDVLSALPAPVPFDPARFFFTSLLQICVTFGFILMMNCRLVMDAQEMAIRDGLTGALNRRSLEDEMTRLTAHCARTGDSLAVMMIDVDQFKSINDRFGHQFGDKVLRHLASLTQSLIRKDDYFARYGGDEFCVVLLSSSENRASILAERLCVAIASRAMEFRNETVQSTISIGIADSAHVGLEFRALVAAADLALYGAKKDGRNRMKLHSTLSAGTSGHDVLAVSSYRITMPDNAL